MFDMNWIDEILKKKMQDNDENIDDIKGYIEKEFGTQMREVIKRAKELGFSKSECYIVMNNLWIMIDFIYKIELEKIIKEVFR